MSDTTSKLEDEVWQKQRKSFSCHREAWFLIGRPPWSISITYISLDFGDRQGNSKGQGSKRISPIRYIVKKRAIPGANVRCGTATLASGNKQKCYPRPYPV